MNEIVRKDILFVFKRAIRAVKRGDVAELKRISNMTIHNASTYQDSDSITVAVVIYALYKICSRCFAKERAAASKDFVKCLENIQIQLKKGYRFLQKRKYEDYKSAVKVMFEDIKEIEDEFGLYITEVLKQARIKKGSKIYEHGISAGRAAEMLGISLWELMDYVGHTKIPEQKPIVTKPMRERLKEARELFGGKK